jgi:hypothetical protein
MQLFEAPHTLGMPPPPQVWPATLQVPHEMVLPQPSAKAPQFKPAGHCVRGTQPPSTRFEPALPQRLGVPPPPHVSPATVQVPHEATLPQPSPIDPQFAFSL